MRYAHVSQLAVSHWGYPLTGEKADSSVCVQATLILLNKGPQNAKELMLAFY